MAQDMSMMRITDVTSMFHLGFTENFAPASKLKKNYKMWRG